MDHTIFCSENPTCHENEPYNFTTYFTQPITVQEFSLRKLCLDTRFKNIDDFVVKSCHFVPTVDRNLKAKLTNEVWDNYYKTNNPIERQSQGAGADKQVGIIKSVSVNIPGGYFSSFQGFIDHVIHHGKLADEFFISEKNEPKMRVTVSPRRVYAYIDIDPTYALFLAPIFKEVLKTSLDFFSATSIKYRSGFFDLGSFIYEKTILVHCNAACNNLSNNFVSLLAVVKDKEEHGGYHTFTNFGDITTKPGTESVEQLRFWFTDMTGRLLQPLHDNVQPTLLFCRMVVRI